MKPSALTVVVMVTILACDAELVADKQTRFTDLQRQEILTKHKVYRDQENALDMKTMIYDKVLEKTAQDAADRCTFGHTDMDPPVGENIWVNTVASVSAASVVEAWWDEHADYNYANNSCTEGKMCGHYTQVVWASSNKVGCGVSWCDDGIKRWTNKKTGQLNAGWIIFCQYSPPGNYQREKPYACAEGDASCGASDAETGAENEEETGAEIEIGDPETVCQDTTTDINLNGKKVTCRKFIEGVGIHVCTNDRTPEIMTGCCATCKEMKQAADETDKDSEEPATQCTDKKSKKWCDAKYKQDKDLLCNNKKGKKKCCATCSQETGAGTGAETGAETGADPGAETRAETGTETEKEEPATQCTDKKSKKWCDAKYKQDKDLLCNNKQGKKKCCATCRDGPSS